MTQRSVAYRDVATDARYAQARNDFLAGRLDDAIAACCTPEDWPSTHAADAVLLAATALSYLQPAVADAFLAQHAALCIRDRSVAYLALRGRCLSLTGNAAGADAMFTTARMRLAEAPDFGASLDFEEARARLFAGRSDPHCREMLGAFDDPSPAAQSSAYTFRAGMHQAIGDYRHQISDLSSALRIALAHPSECEMYITANTVKHLTRAAFELSDVAAMKLAREGFARVTLLPATRSDIYTTLRFQAREAVLHDDALTAQRLLRRAEHVAVRLIQRVSARIWRVSGARSAGSEMWAAEELAAALELAQQADWEHASAEDCYVLLEIARMVAETDVAQAIGYLEKFKTLHARPTGPHPYDERRITALEQSYEGFIRARAGERTTAHALLKAAYETWATHEHHVRARFNSGQLFRLTGETVWHDRFVLHSQASGANALPPPDETRIVVAGNANSELPYERARRDFFAGRLEETLSATDGFESWPPDAAADTIFLRATTFARLSRGALGAGFLRERGGALARAQPIVYHATLGLCFTVGGDTAAAAEEFKRARAFERDAPVEHRASLHFAESLGYIFSGDGHALPPGIAVAFEDRSPNGQLLAYWLRACAHMWAGNYPAQLRDLYAALEVAEAHPAQCEVVVVSHIARDLVATGMELSDERAVRLGRTTLDALDPVPATLYDQLHARTVIAMNAFMRGDPANGQQLLRAAEKYATFDAGRIVLLSRRAYVAQLTDNPMWAAEELTIAQEIADAFDWETANSHEISALILLATALAETKSPRSLTYLERHNQLHARMGGLPHYDTRRYDALLASMEGTIRARMGQRDSALALLESAYRVFAPIDHHLRAALVARELHGLTGAKRWSDALFRHAQACGAKAWCVTPGFAGEADDIYASLTPTQKEIFRAICDGMSVAEIGRDTSRSVFTINKHLQAIYTAFDVHSRGELREAAKERRLA
jgi:DNA-binding CsgD family transcriptional regulator/tetratricopeptide (TPR) repeat protein